MEFRHDAERERFVVEVDGGEGTLDYRRLDGGALDFRSTYVPVELRGRGIGDRLVRYGLDYARQRGLSVVPSCPFVGRVIEDHPEYRELVTGRDA